MAAHLTRVALLLPCLALASCGKLSLTPAEAYVGKYKARGGSEEVRFNKPGILVLTVKHNTEFSFRIDKDGKVTGDGQITYDLTPNTQGLDSIVASVRGAMGMVPVPGAISTINQAGDIAGKASDANDAAGVKGGRKRPMGLSYTAPHLKNGPEVRYFRVKGHLEKATLLDGAGQELRIYLEVDGDYKRPDGSTDPNLIAQYEVNGEKEEKSFPCWSPFLDKKYGVLKKGEGGIWTVEFQDKGTHREGKKIWEEYGYYWVAQQRD